MSKNLTNQALILIIAPLNADNRMERSPSGLGHLLGKQAYRNRYRGFKSLSLRINQELSGVSRTEPRQARKGATEGSSLVPAPFLVL